MRLTLFIFLLWPWSLIAAPEMVEVSPRVTFIETGVACRPAREGTRAAPNSVAGHSHILAGDVQFISSDHLVPAVLGVSMGVKVQVSDPAGISDLVVSVTHPPMGPEGVRRQSFVSSIGAGAISQRFYTMDYDYELLLGTWTLEAKHGKEVIYRATFQMVPPETLPDLAGACGYEDLLS